MPEVISKLLKLSLTERMQLAQILMDSVAEETKHAGLTKTQKAELDRRILLDSQGKLKFSSWESTKKRLKAAQ